jgi:hypothetical protein
VIIGFKEEGTSMKRMLGIFLLIMLVLGTTRPAMAQLGPDPRVAGGIFNPSDSTLSVRARADSNFISGIVSSVVVTVRWLSSYNIVLSTPSSPIYGITKQGGVGTSGSFSYQKFGVAGGSVSLLTNPWLANVPVELFTTRVSKGTGVGTFELTNTIVNGEWYVEINGDDYTNSTFYQSSATNVPLPIQLSTFSASSAVGSKVILTWTTVSETNNFGFEIQKSLDASKGYQTIPGSFTEGAGTTIEPQTYTYVVSNTDGKSWYYRLKQMDLDGSVTYSEGILAGGSSKPLPTTMALDQNYPNPFNPTTTIDFALPKDQAVTLEVFNILGQRVALLADGFKEAGYYSVPFDARELASGLYFYRLVTTEQTFLKKMMVVK